MAPARLAIIPQTTLATSFIIKPEDVTGTQITFHYDSMPGNQPNAYGNSAFIWQTSQQAIPINTKPYNSLTIPQNQPNGSSVFMGLDVSSESYLVAYATGPDVSNIVASVFIPATGGGPADPNSSQPSLQVTNVGSTSVSFSYAMPLGMQPLSNGDWVGLWQGQGESALYSVQPTWFTQLGTNANSGNWGLNLSKGVIQRGTLYTLGYFKGGYASPNPKLSTLACSASFTG
ncbi:hypothetical protein [Pyxidicoccus xibeiensis]|uniref:hypothetical protein n=1 Tax=Pyxidicoccus xibeiensis TaxID=2906759 RepID=UPI0020A6E5DC|nr:hypothetical protein [Pyxidicoccus xibeiensis]MCP3140382.1 hypothetical protein [Pyxidicoccus xibeiensis]